MADSAPRAPLVLVIRDGWGKNPNPEHDAFNAVKLATTPVADRLAREYPATLIRTSGEDVGLPAGVMGNSEVGHQNIGAGRIVDQELMRITRAIRDGSFLANPALVGALEHVTRTGGRVHLLRLVSDGLVHSDLEHLLVLIDLYANASLSEDRVAVHAITDGRDTGPRSGLEFVRRVQEHARGKATIASVLGRCWAMDRDHRWDRVGRAWACLTGRGELACATRADGASAAIGAAYESPTDPNRTGDEFIEPTQILPGAGNEPVTIGDGDAVVFFNFRGDRPRELTRAFTLDDQAWGEVRGGGFERGARIEDLYFCTMARYEQGLPVTAVAFEKPPKMPDILGQVISGAGLTEFRTAETEKYPHVTYFFNDYREEPFPGEQRRLVPSPRDVATYDQKPEMSGHGVCECVLERLGADDCEALLVVNFANADMVGHTGNLQAAVRAVEVADECVGRIAQATLARGGTLIITADHGNAEQMWDPVHECPHTAHTTYDVPLIVVGEAMKGRTLRGGGRLADIAPTALAILGLEQPPAMTGSSLLNP